MAPPNKTALLLIDPYNEFLHPDGKLNGLIKESLAEKDTIKHLQELVDAARKAEIPIFYCLHQQMRPGFIMGWNRATAMQKGQKANVAFEEGSWGVEFYAGLEPVVDSGAGDVVVSKHWTSSGFQNTDLDYQLRQREITHLVLGSLVANTCLESTARYAVESGYNVTLVKDATAGFSKAQADAAIDLIWPLFANEITTAQEWAASVA